MRKPWLAGLFVASLTGIAYAQAEQQGLVRTAEDRPSVSILGHVEKPGGYVYTEGETVRGVIERAGGLKKGSEAIYLYVMRVRDRKVSRCLATPDTPTKPWDLVTVETDGGPTPQVFPACPED